MATQMLRRLPPAPGGAPLRREPRRCIRTVVTAAGGTHNTNDVVRVCTHTTCRKQGSRDVVGFFGEVVDHSRVTVKAGGCLGNCGSGPNVVFLPEGRIIRHVATAARIGELVEHMCVGGDSAAKAVRVMELRGRGNAALQKGKVQEAVSLYSDALADCPPHHTHLLYTNRAAARLTEGDGEAALADADAAIAANPQWAKGYLRRAEALELLGRNQDALQAMHTAMDVDGALVDSSAFRASLQRVKQAADAEPAS